MTQNVTDKVSMLLIDWVREKLLSWEKKREEKEEVDTDITERELKIERKEEGGECVGFVRGKNE